MAYLYEQSTDSRFQQLAQALFLGAYPRLQCFPVGMPDGGRDGLDADTQTIFQVKFKKRGEEESAEWMINALKKELPKIKKLAVRGGLQYVMVTNAQGTSHSDTGSMDKVQKWMNENLPIPGKCYWRTDLDVRIDAAPTSLKLKHAELFTLSDGLDLLFNTLLPHALQRRQDTVRVFIAKQFEVDSKVKFKQVNFNNNLVDLFIDVPVHFRRTRNPQKRRTESEMRSAQYLKAIGALSAVSQNPSDDELIVLPNADGGFSRFDIGAATMLLSDEGQNHLPDVLLQGAPGQGKSTIAQYVCQVQRARYLGHADVLGAVPEQLLQSAFRLPVKVDLRDLAAFLDGESPFPGHDVQAKTRSFTSFVAELICFESGGLEFSADDVLTLFKASPSLLFLDGLDEVPDEALREKMVVGIGETLASWRSMDVDLQVVVTSRPAMFGRKLGLDRFGFTTVILANIDDKRIEDYAARWTSASELDVAERDSVLRILNQKLELPHIRDLTRNPMQLTILLSLIHQVGHSLPDQRTDLYGRYMDLFLTREADKNTQFRDNRTQILEFVEYLAWTLQAQAESERGAGRISVDDLRQLARQFLEEAREDTALADDLFGGGFERIFVVVERYEGQYEFEVQPLREFFCARYLYSTAPVGTYRSADLRGDRAQRFEALASNPFWLNVCRFYAGACERGELGTLVFSLKEMMRSDNLGRSLHARLVAVALLQDWVFSSQKFQQEQLIQAVFDKPGVFDVLGGSLPDEELVLDKACGRDDLRDVLFSHLKAWPKDHRTAGLCALIRGNGGSSLTDQFLELLVDVEGDRRTAVLARMLRCGAAASLSDEQIERLIFIDNPTEDAAVRRVAEVFSEEPTLARRSSRLTSFYSERVSEGYAEALSHGEDPITAFASLVLDLDGPMRSGFWFASTREQWSQAAEDDSLPAVARNLLSEVSASRFIDVSAERTSEFNASLAAAESLTIEACRAQLGDTWAAYRRAVYAAGLPGGDVTLSGVERLFSADVPLLSRARYARLKRGGSGWWIEQLDAAQSSTEKMFWVAMVAGWTSPAVLRSLSAPLTAASEDLSETEYQRVSEVLSQVGFSQSRRNDRKALKELDLRHFGTRASFLIALESWSSGVRLHLDATELVEPLATYFALYQLRLALEVRPRIADIDGIDEWLKSVQQLQTEFPVGERIFTHLHKVRRQMPAELAHRVINQPEAYPRQITAAAASRAFSNYRSGSLVATAQAQSWEFR